ncbi:anticodon-binding domain-containing protein [Massariosphaeria phaeospora]|uniref:Anticodon-binding domain-containing protein n=1 Tax=Massariosphaeria phaeospora TaxID=100035 RepID=A0A7C8MDK0_9PLEO|nr:anticodon-binding domain-containing protein [Massariosphaeria phaeospora]
MADTKRQSIVGKIATPKVHSAKDVIDGDAALYKAVGARIKITCAPHNNVLEGTLFTTCNITNAIAINTAPAPPNPAAPLSSQPGDYHIIPFAHILQFELVGPGERVPESGAGFDGALPSIAKVDLDALKQREEQTIRDMKKRDAQKGKGVTKEAQEIFDVFARTLPTRWHGSQIVVNDAVLIDSPYNLDSLKAPAGKEQSVDRVRKILDNHYQRKKATVSNRAPVATPIAPRKGG